MSSSNDKTQPAESSTEKTVTPEAIPGTRKRDRPTPEGDDLNPTRYGDWSKNGRCIDF